MLIELDPVDRLTAGAVGEPGARTFFLQGRQGARLVTLLIEKEQVQLLAASVVEILARVGAEPPEEAELGDMNLEPPLEPEWRAGRLAIRYDEDRDLLSLEVEERVADSGEEDEDEGDEAHEGVLVPPPGQEEEGEPGRVRFWATREQMLALARQGAAVCAAGRATCRFCLNPIDPEGHTCPAMNGHRELG
jgi:uncharacterized repeat protein (TIGR03847 family)